MQMRYILCSFEDEVEETVSLCTCYFTGPTLDLELVFMIVPNVVTRPPRSSLRAPRRDHGRDDLLGARGKTTKKNRREGNIGE